MDGEIPWLSLIILAIIVLAIIAFCLLGWKTYIPKIISCIETTCYWTYRVIIWPFQQMYFGIRWLAYPIKQCFCNCHERWMNYYYPYLIVT